MLSASESIKCEWVRISSAMVNWHWQPKRYDEKIPVVTTQPLFKGGEGTSSLPPPSKEPDKLYHTVIKAPSRVGGEKEPSVAIVRHEPGQVCKACSKRPLQMYEYARQPGQEDEGYHHNPRRQRAEEWAACCICCSDAAIIICCCLILVYCCFCLDCDCDVGCDCGCCDCDCDICFCC